MDKWDKKENGFDAIIPMIQKYLDNESKEKTQLFHFSASLTKQQLKEISEVLNK